MHMQQLIREKLMIMMTRKIEYCSLNIFASNMLTILHNKFIHSFPGHRRITDSTGAMSPRKSRWTLSANHSTPRSGSSAEHAGYGSID